MKNIHWGFPACVTAVAVSAVCYYQAEGEQRSVRFPSSATSNEKRTGALVINSRGTEGAPGLGRRKFSLLSRLISDLVSQASAAWREPSPSTSTALTGNSCHIH